MRAFFCALLAPIFSSRPAPPAFDFYFRPPPPFKASQVLDVDGDGQRERVEVDSRKPRALRIRRGTKVLWSGVQARAHPWCLRVGDVDGDGRKEIALGTFKATRLWPQPHRTLSIYSWNGRVAKAKWLGSRLSLPFREFFLCNMDSDRAEELLAIEKSENQTWSLAVYKWDVFGFTLKKRSQSWNILQILEVSPRRLRLRANGREMIVRDVSEL